MLQACGYSTIRLRTVEIQWAPVAQWIVHKIADLEVVGSTPAGRTDGGLSERFKEIVSKTIGP